jgi:hypothetical protein
MTMSPFSLLNLPLELVIHVLCHLSISDLLSCQLAHSSLCGLIKSSVLIKFNRATEAAGIDVNPHGSRSMSVKERLGLLAKLEKGWSNFNVDFSTRIAVDHNPSNIYDLTGGMYLLGDKDRHSLHYCALPTTSSDQAEWCRLDVESDIIDVGLARHEHNLIAVITS